jgi:hypothetical protein
LDFIKQLISQNHSVCVRLVGADSTVQTPVAWSLQYDDGSVGMGYTIEAHRKKGLMQSVLIQLVDQVLNASPEHATCGFVVLGNHASKAMMNSLGLQSSPEHSVWLGWSKKQVPSSL